MAVSVSYTGGEWSGVLAKDMVSIATAQHDSAPHSTKAFIALIKSSNHFFIHGATWEGILGLAYPSLAKVTDLLASGTSYSPYL